MRLNRFFTLALATAVLLAVGSCGKKGRRSAKAGPSESSAEGVTLRLVEKDGDHEDLDVVLRVANGTNYPVVIERDEIVVVQHNGRELRPTEGGRTLVISGGDAARFELHFYSDEEDLEDGEGLWVRMDGVYIDDGRLTVPAVAIDSPTHGPGTHQQYDVPPRAREEYQDAMAGGDSSGEGESSFPGKVAGTVAGAITGAIQGFKSGKDAGKEAGGGEGGVEAYEGRRRRIGSTGSKVAAMPLKASQVPEQLAFIMDELLLTELQNVGFEAIGPDDINAMLGFEGMKDKMGCDDASCVAEIGNALGVPYLTAGSVASLDGSTVITLKLIDVRKTTVLARVSRIAEGGSGTLPRVIGEAVQEMVLRSGL